MIAEVVLGVTTAYLLGSLPFAYIITRLKKGIDIRQVGTRNVGAMNTAREIGLFYGLLVLLLDIAKGSLAILLAQFLGLPLIVAGIAALVGHSWPIFLHFKGGRGAATTLGVLLAITPVEFGISFLAMLALFLLTRNSGLSIGTGLALLPLVIWAFGKEVSFITYPLAMSVFLILRNIVALKHDFSKARSFKEFIFRKNRPLWRKRKK